MTDAATAFRRTVTLRDPSGRPLATVPALPAAVALAAALAVAPRITALAALAGLMRRLSLTLDGAAANTPPSAR